MDRSPLEKGKRVLTQRDREILLDPTSSSEAKELILKKLLTREVAERLADLLTARIDGNFLP